MQTERDAELWRAPTTASSDPTDAPCMHRPPPPPACCCLAYQRRCCWCCWMLHGGAAQISNWGWEDGDVRTAGLLETFSQGGITREEPRIPSRCASEALLWRCWEKTAGCQSAEREVAPNRILLKRVSPDQVLCGSLNLPGMMISAYFSPGAQVGVWI